MVAAWEPNGTGYVVDYGAWPEQGGAYFTLTGARNTLAKVYPTAGIEGGIFAGAKALLDRLRAAAYVRQDGAVMRPNLILKDTRYKPDTIHAVLSRHGGADVMPALGVGLGAANKPFSDYNQSDGLLTPEGDPASITIFGKDQNGRKLAPSAHRMLADHCIAEYFVTTQGRGRTVDEWKLRPNKPDNHFWDCLVGATAAGSVLGANPITVPTNTKPKQRRTKRRKVSYL